MFFVNRLKEVYGLFSEVYSKIIESQKNYNPRLPKQYFFVMAIKGYPVSAYYLCKLNLLFISIIKKLKSLIGC